MRWLVVLAAACACNGETPAKMRKDAPTIFDADCWDGGDVCNVLVNQGCCSGFKCTWLIDGSDVGHMGCAPDGSQAVGSACSITTPNPRGSLYDDCVPGAYCEGGSCRTICGFSGSSSECGSSFSCENFDGVFGPAGMTPAAGVCVASCYPLNDNDFLGSGAKTGSACSLAQGCYAIPAVDNATVWTCKPETNPTLVHRSPVAQSTIDACAQGYEPIYADAEGSTQLDCIALCAPLDCYAGNCGSNSANLGGAEPHACNGSDARGTFNVASATNNGDQCMYSWAFEANGGFFLKSPTSNTVGFCIDHSHYGLPSCDSLALGSAAMYGCVSTTLAGVPRANALKGLSLRLGTAR